MTYKEAIEILRRMKSQIDNDNKLLALDIAIRTLDKLDINKQNAIDCLQYELAETMESLKKANERIQELEAQLEESRAKEGKGYLEAMVESFGQLVSSLNEALQGMTPEEIRELIRPDEEEEDD